MTGFDLLVALGGGDDRKQKAVQLFTQGLAPHILFTGDSNYNQEYAQYGIPTAAWVTPAFISTNTWGDGDVVREAMITNGGTSVLCVTSSWHIPRASLIFRKDMPNFNLSWVGVPSPESWKQWYNEKIGYLRALVTR